MSLVVFCVTDSDSFHLDHCGALPWFLEKVCTKDGGTVSCVKVDDFVFQTTFKGRVFMTHATKAIYRWLLSDYIKVRYGENYILKNGTFISF